MPVDIDNFVAEQLNIPSIVNLDSQTRKRIYQILYQFISDRIQERYIKTFYVQRFSHNQNLLEILSKTNNFFLADDHEFWNNYPNQFSLGTTSVALGNNNIFEHWDNIAKNHFQLYGDSQSTRIWNSNDISFFKLDTRINRSNNTEIGFCNDADLSNLAQWISGLFSPGVLIISQPIFVEAGSVENNIQSYSSQFREFWTILESSQHDIICLCGDVHFGRLSVYNAKGIKIIEIVASPLKLISAINGIEILPFNSGRVPSEDAQKPYRYMDKSLTTLWKSTNDNLPVRMTSSGGILGTNPISRENFCILEFVKDKGNTLLTVNHFEITSNAITEPSFTKKFNIS